MDDFIKYIELSYHIFAIAGLISIVWTFFTLVVYRKQLYHSTLSRCIDIYRKDFTDLATQPTIENCNKYIDFVNEELFYMQNGFIPNDVSREWLYGIIIHFPVFINGVNGNPSNVSKVISDNNLLASFPRLVHSFTLKKKHNIAVIFNPESREITKEKRGMINEILKNVKSYNNN